MNQTSINPSNKKQPPDIMDTVENIQPEVLYSRIHEKELRKLEPYKTTLRNAILLDFRILELSDSEVYQFIKKYFPKARTIKKHHLNKTVEIGFALVEEQESAILVETEYNNITINKLILNHASDQFIILFLTHLSHMPTDNETKESIRQQLNGFGTVNSINFDMEDKFLTDKAKVIFTPNCEKIPLEITVDNTVCYVSYRGSEPRCFQCKSLGHVIRECRKRPHNKMINDKTHENKIENREIANNRTVNCSKNTNNHVETINLMDNIKNTKKNSPKKLKLTIKNKSDNLVDKTIKKKKMDKIVKEFEETREPHIKLTQSIFATPNPFTKLLNKDVDFEDSNKSTVNIIDKFIENEQKQIYNDINMEDSLFNNHFNDDLSQ